MVAPMKEKTQFQTQSARSPSSSVAAVEALEEANTGTPRTVEETTLMAHLREAHRARATNLISIFPETPACAAAVFEAFEGPQRDSSGWRFIARAMRAAAQKIESSRIQVEQGLPGASADGVLEREVWRNHHLLKRLLRASPELRRIIEALRAVVAAPGVVNRLGEPGFIEELVELLLAEFVRHAEAFRDGGVPLAALCRSVSSRMDEFYPEFTAESLAQISPASALLRRAGHHEHCAQQLEEIRAA